MPIKQTIPTNSSDSVQFGNATTPVAAQVTGAEVSTGNGYLAMSTTASGTVIERVRVDNAGNVGIGQVPNSTTRLEILSYNGSNGCMMQRVWANGQYGTWFQNASGTNVGNITVNAAATAYNTSSDYRLKLQQKPLENSGTFIDSLKPKSWVWDESHGGEAGVGFIAHEVQEVSPSSVTGEKDAVDAEGNPLYQSMEYGSAEFIANIVAELQSLRKRVAELEAK